MSTFNWRGEPSGHAKKTPPATPRGTKLGVADRTIRVLRPRFMGALHADEIARRLACQGEAA